MKKILERIKTPKTFSTAVITQTSIGLAIVIILLVNFQWKNGIIDIWTPYLLVYLAYLIAIFPILSKFTPSSKSHTRKKYVTAREELIKAQKCAKDNPEDVMMHVRSAIDLSIKERYGFQRIQPMLRFLKNASEFDLPLPSYDLIYKYFGEGSDRIHNGKLNTPFEINQITRTVADFISELDKIVVSEDKIKEFKTKCKWVD